MRKTARIFIVMVVLTACEKQDPEPEINYQSVSQCNQQQDLASLTAKAAGTWEWKFQWCCGSSEPQRNNSEHRGLIIELRNDGTGTTTLKNATVEFTWALLANGLFSEYGFSTYPEIPQLNGILYFCDDIMMCSSNRQGGADHFFKKIKK